MKTFKKIILTILFAILSISQSYSMSFRHTESDSKKLDKQFENLNLEATKKISLPTSPFESDDLLKFILILSINLNDSATMENYLEYLKQIAFTNDQFFKAAKKLYFKITKLAEQINFNGYKSYTNPLNLHPLHFAATLGFKFNYLENLINNNENIEIKANHSYSPLHFAANNGHANCVKLLLDHGAKINEKVAINGYTPLHLAVNNNHNSCVKLLLNYGADPNIKNTYGLTPLDLATKKNYENCINLLRSYKNSHLNYHFLCSNN